MILINKQLVDSMETFCRDLLECGMPKHLVMDTIQRLGDRCLELELYELMNTIHKTYSTISRYNKTSN